MLLELQPLVLELVLELRLVQQEPRALRVRVPRGQQALRELRVRLGQRE